VTSPFTSYYHQPDKAATSQRLAETGKPAGHAASHQAMTKPHSNLMRQRENSGAGFS
jgi:hypothetical protein